MNSASGSCIRGQNRSWLMTGFFFYFFSIAALIILIIALRTKDIWLCLVMGLFLLGLRFALNYFMSKWHLKWHKFHMDRWLRIRNEIIMDAYYSLRRLIIKLPSMIGSLALKRNRWLALFMLLIILVAINDTGLLLVYVACVVIYCCSFMLKYSRLRRLFR